MPEKKIVNTVDIEESNWGYGPLFCGKCGERIDDFVRILSIHTFIEYPDKPICTGCANRLRGFN